MESFPRRQVMITLDLVRGGLVWGIYQLLGKTCPTVYVWSKASST